MCAEVGDKPLGSAGSVRTCQRICAFAGKWGGNRAVLRDTAEEPAIADNIGGFLLLMLRVFFYFNPLKTFIKKISSS